MPGAYRAEPNVADTKKLVSAAALVEAVKAHPFCPPPPSVVLWTLHFILDSAREVGVAHQETHEAPVVLRLRFATLEALGMLPRRIEELLDDIPERWYCQDVFIPRHECCSRRRTAHRPLGGRGIEGWLVAAGWWGVQAAGAKAPRSRDA